MTLTFKIWSVLFEAKFYHFKKQYHQHFETFFIYKTNTKSCKQSWWIALKLFKYFEKSLSYHIENNSTSSFSQIFCFPRIYSKDLLLFYISRLLFIDSYSTNSGSLFKRKKLSTCSLLSPSLSSLSPANLLLAQNTTLHHNFVIQTQTLAGWKSQY